MKTLINLYSAVVGRIEFLNDRNLKSWLADVRKKHESINYFIKKSIITDNLYGVDIMEEATEIAKLRLFLALVASASSVDELEPLPNIDFNIMAGNSLVGLLHKPSADELDLAGVQQDMFKKDFNELLKEKNRLVKQYRNATLYAEDLRALRTDIEQRKKEAVGMMDEILLDRFKSLCIKFEQATWDEKKNKEGKPQKRALGIDDIKKLKPFHWGYEFDEIINEKGGFDAIVTNPPWEIFKPNGKEFFEEYSELVTKKKMTIKEFEKEQGKLLKDEDVLKAWLGYLSEYPHVSMFYRGAAQFKNQISVVNGKKSGTDINLYKLFVEQCFNLIKKSGECGIVIPSGIYTDLGTKRLREMLFEETLVTGLFCFENRKVIFENVDSRFKFVVLTYKKGEATESFPARFMRHDVAELERFPEEDDLWVSIDLVKKLSPYSLSISEFKNDKEVQIVKKMLKWPFLSEKISETWNVELAREFDMSNDSFLFKSTKGKNSVPLIQGNMFYQFAYPYAEPKYWIDLMEGRQAILGKKEDKDQLLNYQCYKFVHRRIASSTNERSAIACILPPNSFCADTAQTTSNIFLPKELIFFTGIFNSFVVDWEIRQRITSHLDMHFVYNMHIPRLTQSDKYFSPIVSRAARLICTTPEFDDLAREVGLKTYKNGVTDPVERARLRAELDGIIAHLYELTEEEFAYILTTFPLVPEPVKLAARNAYRDVERGLIK
jgi:hypothetical protein